MEEKNTTIMVRQKQVKEIRLLADILEQEEGIFISLGSAVAKAVRESLSRRGIVPDSIQYSSGHGLEDKAG